jgi:RNA polymerase sigma-70 factor (ECF subfamily)
MRISDAPDHELAALVAAGDTDAFGQLVARYAPAARRVARAVLANADDADDATQEAFVSAWRHFSRYDVTRPFGPWLMRIVLNASHDLRRRRAVRTGEPLRADRPGATASPELAASRAQLREALAAALSALPERQRLAVVLFDAEGYSHREIAELLGAPEGTVRSDLFHGRRALRAALSVYVEDS